MAGQDSKYWREEAEKDWNNLQDAMHKLEEIENQIKYLDSDATKLKYKVNKLERTWWACTECYVEASYFEQDPEEQECDCWECTNEQG